MKNRSTPPRIALRFFRWYCHPRLVDHIEGDLIEVYVERVKKDGQGKADWRFMIDVLLLFRPGIIAPLALRHFELINTNMIRNYTVVAFRNLIRHKLFATINIMGLSLGVTVCVLIMLFVTHEISYDSFHKNETRIFKMRGELNYGGQIINTPAMSAAFGPLLANATAEVRNFVRMRKPGRVVVHSNDQRKFFEDAFIFADSSFFSVFSFQILEGSRESLGQPGKVFITPRIKEKYFGTESAIGKLLTYQNQTSLEIAGIVAPAPSNSSIRFDFIASFSSLGLLPDENESDSTIMTGLVSVPIQPICFLIVRQAQRMWRA
jgi:putative ABC transport system permease protein